MAKKRGWLFLLVLVVLLFFSGVAGATLYDRGGGLIYDDVLNITWLQDANYAQTWMTWADAVAWAENLDYGGYDDWRLPTAVDGEYVWGYDGTTTGGYNITSSEMGYMFYENLGNRGYYATDGTSPQPGWGLTNVSFIDGTTGDLRSFQNLQAFFYWSGTEYSLDPNSAWYFYFGEGFQYPLLDKDHYLYAWAVRPGDVSAPVPEPATMLLLGSGLVGLAGVRRKFKKS